MPKLLPDVGISVADSDGKFPGLVGDQSSKVSRAGWWSAREGLPDATYAGRPVGLDPSLSGLRVDPLEELVATALQRRICRQTA